MKSIEEPVCEWYECEGYVSLWVHVGVGVGVCGICEECVRVGVGV